MITSDQWEGGGANASGAETFEAETRAELERLAAHIDWRAALTKANVGLSLGLAGLIGNAELRDGLMRDGFAADRLVPSEPRRYGFLVDNAEPLTLTAGRPFVPKGLVVATAGSVAQRDLTVRFYGDPGESAAEISTTDGNWPEWQYRAGTTIHAPGGNPQHHYRVGGNFPDTSIMPDAFDWQPDAGNPGAWASDPDKLREVGAAVVESLYFANFSPAIARDRYVLWAQ